MMKYFLENEYLKIAVKAIGAELCQLQSKNTSIEYMWQAHPDIWGSHAPVLFPIVGGLKEDKYIFNDKEYQLPRHGFIRRNKQLELLEKNEDTIILQLSSNSDTHKIYPFEFDFKISFKLSNKKLQISHSIINKDTKALYFSLGGHPGFNCPILSNEKYEDYYLEFEREESLNTWNLDQNGLIKEEGELVMNQSKKIRLHKDLFHKDALIFKSLKSRQVILCHKDKGERLKIDFQDFPSLGIWAKPGAPFVCIEPWLGYADKHDTNQQLSEKEAITSLAPGSTFEASYTIEVVD